MNNSTSGEHFGIEKSDPSTSTSKIGRPRKVNWTATSEEETFNTVLVNYKVGQDKSSPKTVSAAPSKIPRLIKRYKKPCSAWKPELPKMKSSSAINAASAISEAATSTVELGSELNLRKLYGDSMLELRDYVIEEAPENKELPKEVNEITKIPSEEKQKETKVEELRHAFKALAVPTYDDVEIIIISDDEECNESPKKESSSAPQLTAWSECPLRLECSCPYSNNTKATSTSHHLVADQMRPFDSMENIEDKLNIKVTLPEPVKKATERSSSTELLKIKKQPLNTFKQRQLELHRHRIAVEQKRLEVLELKLARERDEMMREQILFEKELELKVWQMRQLQQL